MLGLVQAIREWLAFEDSRSREWQSRVARFRERGDVSRHGLLLDERDGGGDAGKTFYRGKEGN